MKCIKTKSSSLHPFSKCLDACAAYQIPPTPIFLTVIFTFQSNFIEDPRCLNSWVQRSSLLYIFYFSMWRSIFSNSIICSMWNDLEPVLAADTFGLGNYNNFWRVTESKIIAGYSSVVDASYNSSTLSPATSIVERIQHLDGFCQYFSRVGWFFSLRLLECSC